MMSSHVMIDVYGHLSSAEMEIASSHSNIPEIELALRETVKHLQAAQISLRTAIVYHK